MPIQKLPQLLVNQIAAGEVIERPASVVKELVENSLDAGAAQIDIAIEEGGSQLIRVSDNGSGIPSDELLLAVAPHATSKLATPDDLASIMTLGFRGEAIASIASVSRLRLTSRAVVGGRVAEAGGLIEVVGGDGGAVEPVGMSPGSVVEVRDLFFNTPARRKFLRSASAEFGHIAEVVDRIAMSHPGVGFTLSHQGRKVAELVATDSRKRRCIDLLGQDIEEALLEFESEPVFGRPGMESLVGEAGGEPVVWGLAGLPAIARSSSKFQFICVNGRPIRDRSLSHAVKEAYRGLIDPDKQPVAVVFVEVPHGAVDVNVHPAKAEVRFRDPSRIHGLVLTSIRRRLLGADLTPKVSVPAFGRPAGAIFSSESIGQEQPIRISAGGEAAGIAAPAWSPDAFVDYFKRMAPQQRGMVFEQVKREMVHELPDGVNAVDESATGLIGGSSDYLPIQNALPANRILQVHKSYLVTQDEQGILIIDQHALHERVMFEELRQRVLGSDQPLESQRLLMPGIVKAGSRRFALVEQLKPLLDRIGIEVEPMSQSALGIQAFPTFLFDRKVDPVEFVEELLDLAEDGRLEAAASEEEHRRSAQTERNKLLDESVLHKVLDMMACKAAVKAGDAMSSQELTALLAKRSQIERASNCPHGRPTTIRLSLDELEKQFKRT